MGRRLPNDRFPRLQSGHPLKSAAAPNVPVSPQMVFRCILDVDDWEHGRAIQIPAAHAAGGQSCCTPCRRSCEDWRDIRESPAPAEDLADAMKMRPLARFLARQPANSLELALQEVTSIGDPADQADKPFYILVSRRLQEIVRGLAKVGKIILGGKNRHGF